MKKTIFACLVLSALTLAGCNNNNASGGKSYNDGFTYAKDSLFTSELAINNIVEPEYVKPTIKTPKLAVNNEYFNSYTIDAKGYASYGLLVLKNEYGNLGFYSLIANDFILERQYEKEWLSYTVEHSNYLGFYLKVRYEDTLKIVDSFGNKLYEGEYDSSIQVSDTSAHQYYSTVYGDDIETRYFRYDKKTGKATVATAFIDDEPEEVNPTDVYEGPEVNDPYREDWEDLAPYGLENYSLVRVGNGLYYVFNNGEKHLQFYVDPSTCSPLGIVGKSFYYQQIIQLDEYATEYSYSVGNLKYSLATYSISLENGKKSEHNYLGVFSSLTPLVDASKNVTCYIIEYNVINKDYCLAESVARIIDPDFKIHDDLSGLDFRYFAKLKNSYFNFSTKVLYNSNLEPITWLGNLDELQFNTNMEMFVGKLDGKYGIVGLDGKVKVEFKYSKLYPSYYANGVLLGEIGNEIYRIRPGQDVGTSVGSYLVVKGENLFNCTTDEGTQLYFSTTANLFEFDPNDVYMSINQKTILGNITYSFIPNTYEGDFTFSRINYTDFVPQTVPSATKGQELEKVVDNGYEERPIQLTLGYNIGHDNNTTNGEYYEFTPEFDSYYVLFTQYYESTFPNVTRTRLINIQYYDEDQNLQNVSFDTDYVTKMKGDKYYDAKYTALLEKGVTYYFLVYEYGASVTQLYNLYFDYERGNNSSYPMVVKPTLEEDESFTFVKPEELNYVNYIYVKFVAPQTGYYSFTIAGESEKILNINHQSGGVYDSNKGMYLFSQGSTGVYRLGNRFDENLSFKFTFEEATIPQGYDLANPYDLKYGYNYINNEIGQIYTYNLLNLNKVYFEYDVESDGLYGTSYSFSSSSYYYNNPEWSLYDVDGNLVTLSTRYDEYYSANSFYSLKEGEKLVFSFEVNTSYSSGVNLYYLRIHSSTGYSLGNTATFSSSYNVPAKYSYYVTYEANSDEEVAFSFISSRFTKDAAPLSYRIDTYESDYAPGEFVAANLNEEGKEYFTNKIELKHNDRIVFKFGYNEDAGSELVSATSTVRYFYGDEVEISFGESTTFDSSVAYYQHYKYTNNTEETMNVGLVITAIGNADVYFDLSKVGYLENNKDKMVKILSVSSGAPNMTDNVVTLEPGETLYLSAYSINNFTFELVDDLSYFVSMKNNSLSYQFSYDKVNNWYVSNAYSSDIFFTALEDGELAFTVTQYGASYGNTCYAVVYINGEQYVSYYSNNGTHNLAINVSAGDVVRVYYYAGYSSSSYYVHVYNMVFTPANA